MKNIWEMTYFYVVWVLTWSSSLNLHMLTIINYYIHLTAFFRRTTWVSWHQKGKPFWILLEQEMMGVAVVLAGPEWYTFLVPAYIGCPGEKAIKRM